MCLFGPISSCIGEAVGSEDAVFSDIFCLVIRPAQQGSDYPNQRWDFPCCSLPVDSNSPDSPNGVSDATVVFNP